MSTLVEIEKAVEVLPPVQQKNLLLWLQSRLARAPVTVPGKASAWLHSARGSVRQSDGRSADDMRMDYYAAKHGLNP